MQNSPTFSRSARTLTGIAIAASLLASVLASQIAPASALARTRVHPRTTSLLAEPASGAVAWGDNSTMQLGAGYINIREEQPVPVLGLSNIASIDLGNRFNVALLGDGTVWTWGVNALGQLGNKTHRADGVPTSVGLHGVTQISAGGDHALALLESGTIADWGDNEYGELGNGVLNPVKRTNARGVLETTMQGSGSQEPVAVPHVANVVAVASGSGDEFALLSNGTLLAWGKNNRGQLGIGKVGPQICKTEVGEVACNTKPEPVLLGAHEPLRGVKAVAAGNEATYALLTNGHVMAWGSNGRGQLGDNSTADSSYAVEVKNLINVVAVAGGAPFGLALLTTGRVMGWGGNGFGQLGAQVNDSCGGEPCVKSPRVIPGLENVSQVSAGYAFTLALEGGRVWALGDGEPWGQLGLGTLLSSNRPRPVEGLPPITSVTAGEQHAVAIAGSGPLPAPRFGVTPGGGALNVSWTVNAPVSTLRWRPFPFASYREATGPWSPMVAFRQTCSASAPCTYSIKGLPEVPYEVELLNYFTSKIVMTRRAVATP
jgi:alpha-tubulin suppressor-like RCC1 family protein